MFVHTHRLLMTAAVVLATAVIVPALAMAQSAAGSTRIGALVGGSFAASASARALAVSARYTFMPLLSVEGEVSHFSDLTLADTLLLGPWQARATAVTGSAVFTLPGGTDRLRPFVSVGGGAARVLRSAPQASAPGPSASRTDVRPVVSAGGGIDVPIGRRLAVGIDVRYQRVLEDERLFRPNLRNMARVGSSVGWRF